MGSAEEDLVGVLRILIFRSRALLRNLCLRSQCLLYQKIGKVEFCKHDLRNFVFVAFLLERY